MDLNIYASHCAIDLMNQWLSFLKVQRQYSPKTIDAYNRDFSYFISFLSQHLGKVIYKDDIFALNVSDIRAYLASRRNDEKPLSNASIGRALAAMRSFYKYCDKIHGLEFSRLNIIRGPKIKERLPRPVTQEQSQELLDTIHEIAKNEWLAKRDEAVLTLLYGCGLRIFECLSMKGINYNNIDSIRVIGKGKKERILPILPIVKEKIAEYVKVCPYEIKKDGPLFFGERGGPLNARQIQKIVERMRHILGLSQSVTPHSFRHSFASHLLQNGSDLRSIQELLGHSSLSATQKYMGIDKDSLIAIYNNSHPRK